MGSQQPRQSPDIPPELIIFGGVLGVIVLTLGEVGAFFGACEGLLNRAWNGAYVIGQLIAGVGLVGIAVSGGLSRIRTSHRSRYQTNHPSRSLFKLSGAVLTLGLGILLILTWTGDSSVTCTRGVVGYAADWLRTLW